MKKNSHCSLAHRILFCRPRLAAFAQDDPYSNRQWYLDKIKAVEAWEISKGSPEVVIAVLRIGVGCDISHPDLAGQFKGGWNLLRIDL